MKSKSRFNLIHGSPQQEDIWEFLRHRTEHGLVDARAGTGKTFTIVQGALRMPKDVRVGVFSFNNHIVKELNAQLRRLGLLRTRAMTYHSFGFKAIRQRFPRIQLIEDKLATLVRYRIYDADAAAALRQLVKLCKNRLEDGDDPDALARIVSEHGIELDPEYEDDVYTLVPQVLEECLRFEAAVDFDDQIWWPVKMRLPVETFDLLLIDEAQDTNRAQQQLALMACPEGRIVVVGDRYQSVYGFRGADSDAIPNLHRVLSDSDRGCEVLPLTVTRRCPSAHVQLVRAIVPDIEAMETAPGGEILCVNKQKSVAMMQPGDMVICRVNRYLLPLALELVKRDIKVVVQGKDFAGGILVLIDQLGGTDIAEFLERLVQHEELQSRKLGALGHRGESRLETLQDQFECLVHLCIFVTDIPELKRTIGELFADPKDDDLQDAVLFGTIHRTKGLERNRVFVIGDFIPHPAAKQAWQQAQERNLAYIAATRAKFEVGKHPGELIFVGSVPDIYKCGPEMLKALQQAGLTSNRGG